MSRKIWASGDRVLASDLNGNFSFGGSGADGALTVSSGTTNIDLGGVAYFEKNYTSISITGTGKVTFSNPHANGTWINLRSQGNVTLTSSQAPMLDASGCGASGGTNGQDLLDNSAVNHYGIAGGAGGNPSGGSGGAGGTAGSTSTAYSDNNVFYTTSVLKARRIARYLCTGSGGNTGGAGPTGVAGGTAGKGGAILTIECAGAWNFTTTNGISVAGTDGGAGGNGSVTTPRQGPGGGGSGGGGGMFYALYNTLTANSGTVNYAGGAGGAGGNGVNGPSGNNSAGTSNAEGGGGGASGGSAVGGVGGTAGAGGAGGAGGGNPVGTSGGTGSNGGAGAGTYGGAGGAHGTPGTGHSGGGFTYQDPGSGAGGGGGGGAEGSSVITQNIWFA